MSREAPLLELRGVSHRFGATVALDDAALLVRPGTIHALLGENGAGKTTLMRVAFGLVAADAGTVLVDGMPVAIRSPSDAIAQRIGMVHQHFNVIPAMTVAENVALGGHGLLDLAAVRRDVRELATASGLPLDPDALAETLSVAQQQRLEILKALARDARVLILDEPTAVLAPAEADELLRWLRAYAARGNAAVLITHKLREAIAAADDITVLRRGRVVLQAGSQHAAADAPNAEQLTAAMLGATERPGDRGRIESANARVDAAGIPGSTSTAPASPRAHSVRVNAVSARRGREQVVDATFTVAGGEITGMAGVEGAGHHLLMLMLAGRHPPDSGAITLPDTIGFIPEDRHRDGVIAEHTLAENLALKDAGSRHGLMRWRAWHRRTDALVDAYDVRGPTDQPSMARLPLRVLSGGNQQKLVVARELEGSPRLVVAENPTRGLDVRAAAAVRARLREAADSGAAVVMYSADLDEVIDVADRVLVVHAGAVCECERRRGAIGRAMVGLA